MYSNPYCKCDTGCFSGMTQDGRVVYLLERLCCWLKGCRFDYSRSHRVHQHPCAPFRCPRASLWSPTCSLILNVCERSYPRKYKVSPMTEKKGTQLRATGKTPHQKTLLLHLETLDMSQQSTSSRALWKVLCVCPDGFSRRESWKGVETVSVRRRSTWASSDDMKWIVAKLL